MNEMKTKIGDYILIGSAKYDTYLADMAEDLGLIDTSKCKIVLNPDQSPEKMRITLMHEIVHGIIEEYAVLKYVGLTEQQEHHITDTLSAGVVKTFIDNKEIFKEWLRRV
jgi:Zn-dependent peptidase ImmA (M78 family)